MSAPADPRAALSFPVHSVQSVHSVHFVHFFLLAVAGCGGGAAGIAEPVPADAKPTTSAPYAAHYGGEAGPVALTAEETAIVARIEGEGPLGCAIEERLVRAARRHAAVLASAAGSQGEAEIDHLRFAVLAEGGTEYQLAPFATRDLGAGLQDLAAFVAEHRRDVTHCGLGKAGRGGRDVVVWVGAKRAVSFAPIPVSSEVGTALTVSGTVSGALGAARAYLGLPDGSADALAARVSGGVLTVEVPFERRGRYELEIQIDLGGGPETASLLPLFAGVPPDGRPTIAAGADDGGASAEAPDARIVSLVNAARKRLGLAPLARDARLDRVAAAHCADMVALGYFGHRSPSGAMLADRLRASELAPSAFGENVARSSSASRVHRNLMASPSHRIELLSRSYTHLGVGVARDGDDLVVTEVLARW